MEKDTHFLKSFYNKLQKIVLLLSVHDATLTKSKSCIMYTS